MTGCTGECQQGRKQCPTPQACFLPDKDLEEPKIDWAFVAYNAIMILIVIAGVVWTLWGNKWI